MIFVKVKKIVLTANTYIIGLHRVLKVIITPTRRSAMTIQYIGIEFLNVLHRHIYVCTTYICFFRAEYTHTRVSVRQVLHTCCTHVVLAVLSFI